ncbi:hypothetical protein MSSD14B_17820 [Marinobacter salsuginis]|jgi:hypothetical protein|uniref:Uncharacterized protein n=1 Tax=Marinobacter salsuginis TaxID=418719 RepID=A0A5M3PYU4_9GAMM|nr:hypothetical protein MSSD14B_17820 [Marinobacter salsuginis]
MENIERIQLLSSTEVESYMLALVFNTHEQSLHFSLSPVQRATLELFRNTPELAHIENLIVTNYRNCR